MTARMSSKIFCQHRNFISNLISTSALLVVVSAMLAGCAGISGRAAVSSPVASPSPTPTPNPNATTFVYATDAGGLSPNDTAGDLFILNTRNGSTTQVAVPGVPEGLAVTPDGARMYVAQTKTGSVAVVDSQSHSVIATIPVGQSPVRVAITPNRRYAYVTNFQDGTVSVIDTTVNAVIKTVFTDSVPLAVAFSADGAWAYVALADFVGNEGGPNHENALVVMDTTTQTIVKRIPLLTGQSMAASPTKHELYLLEGFDIAVIDTDSNELAARIPINTGQQEEDIAVSPDGRLIYVAELGNIDLGPEDPPTVTPATVYVISAEQRAVIAKAHTDPGLVSIAISPDGGTAYLLENEMSLPGIKTMDTRTLTFSPLIPMAGTPIQLAVGTH